MSRRVKWIVDGQGDFMDRPGAALPVPGGYAAMDRAAQVITEMPLNFFDEVMGTFDSHDYLHIAHPIMWEGKDGKPPTPFTMIFHDAIKDGTWTPRFAKAKPDALGGRTILEWALYYTEQLEATGQKVHMIWNPHCIPGTQGWSLQPNLEAAIRSWCNRRFHNFTRLTKGNCVWTEHFGGFQAGVPLASDPSTMLNTRVLKTFEKADEIWVSGVASSHCVPATIVQAAEYFGWNNAKKFVLLTDCMSPVGPVCDPSGKVLVDFPKIASDWLKDMESKGMRLLTSKEAIAQA
jgi:nicotinamidase/pyrazinamidase